MNVKTFLQKLKPTQIKIKIVGALELEIFKHDKENKYSAKFTCCSESDYYTNQFDYIKYYSFSYLKKKIIKDYGNLEIKEQTNE